MTLRLRERIALVFFPPRDPWARLSMRPPVHAFGPGARQDFAWYFQGESGVDVRQLDDMLTWLGTCEYTTDHEAYQVTDFWQHPRTFELMRRGDCEDFALWAWRKLVELGFDAQFVVGYTTSGPEAGRRHAWVQFRDRDTDCLLEPCQRNIELAVRPLDAVRDAYFPEYGVDLRGNRFAFAGYAIARSRARANRPSSVVAP
ncbi:MAG: transglutaminase-like cysteine peptidase [Gemmatimonadaceae bacterium]